MLWADLERVDSIAFFFLCQKIANLNTALGLGRNNQCGVACIQEPEKHVHVPKRPYINFEELVMLVCWRVGVSASWLSASWLSASWFISELSSYLILNFYL